MSFWVLVQIFLNFAFLSVIGLLWMKLHRPQKDDPRLSRGLQLLQSKISVLEDLSDRTEDQVQQLTGLIEQKCRELQKLLNESEEQGRLLEKSLGKSLEAAKLINEEIPHQEIVERQNTIKYVKAAQMAHAGASIDDIAAAVDLSRGEIEFIAKVNRDHLQFSTEDLPLWLKEELKDTLPIRENGLAHSTAAMSEQSATMPQTFTESSLSSTIIAPPVQTVAPTAASKSEKSLSELGERFRQALEPAGSPPQIATPVIPQSVASVARPSQTAAPRPRSGPAEPVIKKVIFPKVNINNNLG